jgi:transposase
VKAKEAVHTQQHSTLEGAHKASKQQSRVTPSLQLCLLVYMNIIPERLTRVVDWSVTAACVGVLWFMCSACAVPVPVQCQL